MSTTYEKRHAELTNRALGDMSSRCALCGKDMSARDLESGGEQCAECADGDDMDESGADTTGPRPGGWSRTDNKPQPLAKAFGPPAPVAPRSTPARYAKIPTFQPKAKPKAKA